MSQRLGRRVNDVQEFHDGGSVVDGGDAIVLTSYPVRGSPGLVGPGRKGGIAVGGEQGRFPIKKITAVRGFFKVRSDLGRTRVVRTESTTAMQALMLEMSWPLPWLVSVPSRRSTIWGCCWWEEGGRRKGSDGGQP